MGTSEWEPHDPGVFMAGMNGLRDRIDNLTLENIGEYIEERYRADLVALKTQEAILMDSLDLPPPTSMGPRQRELNREVYDSMIDYIIMVRNYLIAVVDQAQAKPPPNEFANHEKWRMYQQKPDAILCLRPADKMGLPIPLMHVAFCNFTHYFHEPTLDEHTEEYLTMADKLCQVMPSAFDDAGGRRRAFETIFASLDKDLKKLSPSAKESGARFDLAKTIDYERGRLILLLEEFKVESTGDIYMQICRSYEVLCEEEKNKRLLEFGNPVFLLCVLGPFLMVCGVFKHENVHIEPLTPLLPMFPGVGIQGCPVQLAYCLQALKEGLDSLRAFWQIVGIIHDASKKAAAKTLPEPYLVSGYPDNGLLQFDNWQGTFVSPIRDVNNLDKSLCFLAKLDKPDDGYQAEVVVKFVYNYIGTYGTAVHEYLHSCELAPLLYSAKKLHRGLVMVVMERLSFEKGWMELDTFEGKLDTRADAVREKLDEIVKLLQEQKMVHVDLRPKNIMVKVDGDGQMMMDEHGPFLRVINFDWAGKVGDAYYPPFLNKKVPWPTGAEAYQKVGKNNDEILLNTWWASFVKGSQ